jgi:hypothetical protein
MRPVLEAIRSAEALRDLLDQLRTLWEEVVWPISEIGEPSLAQQLIVIPVLLNDLYAIGVGPAPESGAWKVLWNKQISDLAELIAL